MALNSGKLKDDLKAAFDNVLPSAFEEAYKSTLKIETEDGNETARRFAEKLKNLIDDTLAESMADAIDAYVRNMQIDGHMNLLGVTTVGTMVAQTQVVPLPLIISTLPKGVGGGTIPGVNNFILGIS